VGLIVEDDDSSSSSEYLEGKEEEAEVLKFGEENAEAEGEVADKFKGEGGSLGGSGCGCGYGCFVLTVCKDGGGLCLIPC
jgi:hypothetical protein